MLGLKSRRNVMKNNIAVILGNGPSLRNFDFHKELSCVDTFGINAAYRYWDQINWYPTYYASCDPCFCREHREDCARLVANKKKYGIQKFLLDIPAVEYLKQLQLFDEDIVNYRAWLLKNYSKRVTADIIGSGGALAALWASFLGYNIIILLGIDANYGINSMHNYELCYSSKSKRYAEYKVLDKSHDASNYFFDSYMQDGEIFRMNEDILKENELHIKAFYELSILIDKSQSSFINANLDSNVIAFPKMTWGEAKEKFILPFTN